jgi:hypothetical protein
MPTEGVMASSRRVHRNNSRMSVMVVTVPLRREGDGPCRVAIPSESSKHRPVSGKRKAGLGSTRPYSSSCFLSLPPSLSLSLPCGPSGFWGVSLFPFGCLWCLGCLGDFPPKQACQPQPLRQGGCKHEAMVKKGLGTRTGSPKVQPVSPPS